VRRLDFIKSNIKKIRLIINEKILISPLFNSGKTAIIKKTTKKTIPMLLLELILILSFFKKLN